MLFYLVYIIVCDFVLACGSYVLVFILILFFFFKQKTAYEMRISDWSSDVCSSDLPACAATSMERTVFPLCKSKAFSLSPAANHTCRPSKVTTCTCPAPGTGPYPRRISAAEGFMTTNPEQTRGGRNRQRITTAPGKLFYPLTLTRSHIVT